MATKRTSTGASGGFGGLLNGINAGMEADNKNRFKVLQENNKRRFELSKIMATDQLAQNRNMFNREQTDIAAGNRDFQKRVWDKMDADKKEREADPNEIAAFTTGKFTPAMMKGLGELPLEDQVALIKEMAKRKGWSPSGEREETTDGGFLGIGKKTQKIPTYTQNQFQR